MCSINSLSLFYLSPSLPSFFSLSPTLPPFFLSLSLSLPLFSLSLSLPISLGDWFTAYPYIDIVNVAEGNCASANRVWAPAEYGQSSQCLVLPPPLDCQQVGWSRSNHLGNGRDGVPLNYTWTIPYFPSGLEKRVVVRIR